MTKAEMTERLVDRLVDPFTDNLEDYEYAEPIDLEYAKSLLKDLRHEDVDIDDPDFAVPAGVTPELLMETFNCLLRAKQHELTIQRLADYITENEMVCEYDQYFADDRDPKRRRVLPVDFLCEGFPFRFDDSNNEPSALDLVCIGSNSRHTFNSGYTYCYYDDDLKQLSTTDTPFGDEVIDAQAFAEWIMSPEGEECREYFTECLMDEDDIEHVFGKGDE